MSKVCVSVCVSRIEEMQRAIERASAGADMVELRLDCLNDLSAAKQLVDELDAKDNSLILTLRPEEQGGHASVDYQSRQQFWLSLKGIPDHCFFDLEHDLVRDLSAGGSPADVPFDWSRIICSHHDFTGVPPDLDQIYEALAATPAGVLKIAIQAKDATDSISIFRLLDRAGREGRKLIAIAMGNPGLMTRVLGPARGSFITYAAPQGDLATAPGQTTVAELRNRYRIDQINEDTEIFGIIGSLVAHSLSPRIHNAAFAAANLNAVFIPLEVHDPGQFIRRLAHPRSREIQLKLRGLSVTIPHKSAVMPLLDWIDPTAKDIGAVNTIVVKDDRLLGYNTDAPGFIAPLLKLFGPVKNMRCAVIGAGGGARAVLWALRNEGAEVHLFAGDRGRASLTARDFGALAHDLASGDFAGFDIVVNATPLGMSGVNQDATAAIAAQLRGVRLAYDLVYNPSETRFLLEARNAGCQVLGGIEMLLAQAIEQFKLWTGTDPDAKVMRAAALSGLRH